MRQVRTELRRFLARRMVRGVVLIAAFIIVLSVSIAAGKGHPGHELSYDPTTGQYTDPRTGQVLDNPGPISTQVIGNDGSAKFTVGQPDTRINVAKDLANTLQGTSIALLFAAFAVGASFVGAEFNVGSLTTQLLFEPRRWRVHLAKAAAVAIGTFSIALAVMGLVAVSMYVGSVAHGVSSGVDGTFVVDRIGEALRLAAAVAAGAVMTYGVTLVAKRSSAGMILFFLQFPLLNLLDPTKMPFGLVSHYEPLRGLLGVILRHSDDTGVQARAIHTTAGGAVLVAVWIVVIVAGSGSLFARAEVR